VDLGHGLLNALQARVAELEDGAAVDAEEVVVLPVGVGPLVLRLAPTELVLDDEVALEEQLQRVVDGSTTHAHALRLDPREEGVGVEVVAGGVEGVEDGEALGRLALPALLQERGKEATDLVELGLGEGHR